MASFARSQTTAARPRPFEEQLRDALAHLDDLAYLQTHPLARAFQTEPGRNGASAAHRLRRALVEAIETLRPAQDSADPHAWRGYQIMRLHHAEGRGIPAVLDRLAISRSEYYRDYRRALAAVAAVVRDRLPASASRVVPSLDQVNSNDGASRVAVRAPRLLPLPLTSFVGRTRERAELKALLGTTRLLTLTGTAGVGKTRLMLEVATDAAGGYRDGVVLAELAALTDPALLPRTVAAAFGIVEQANEPVAETLTAALDGRMTLLLLDNCEHLLDACARLVEALLRSCPELHVLASSREALGIPGEVRYAVAPLAVPDTELLLSVVRLGESEAVKLFVDRATAVQPHFALSERTAGAVAAICRQLDGLPLALELAAAQLGAFPVTELVGRLDRRFGMLARGNRTAPQRQQALRTTLDWSYDLLSEQERRLFDRLAAFEGGWTLEATEAICAGDGIADDAVIGILRRLVDASLVQADEQPDGHARFRLLETVRHYARERLAARPENDDVRLRHAAYYAELAEELGAKLNGAEAPRCLSGLEQELGNVRAALRWTLDGGDGVIGLRLGAALWWFWLNSSRVSEGRQWLEGLLALPCEAPPGVRARALLVAGHLAEFHSDVTAARPHLEESLRLARALGDRWLIAWALVVRGYVANAERDGPTAAKSAAESFGLFQELGDRHGMAGAVGALVCVAEHEGDGEMVRARLAELLALARELGDRARIANALDRLADIALVAGDLATAETLGEEMLALARELGAPWNIGRALDRLGQVAMTRGELGLARARLREGLLALRQTGNRKHILPGLDACARLALAQGQPERAARIVAGARQLGAIVGTLGVEDPTAHDRLFDAVRRQLSSDACARAHERGEAMTTEQVIAEALAATDWETSAVS